jgi:PTS system mannose-specific IIB component/fructoselysine and glucoselysine-specific PTS system IIB component
MPDLVFHIDSRCIHGQVVAGWGHQARIRRFLLADDAVAADAWEREQYRATPGAEFETSVTDITEGIRLLKSWTDDKRTMLIVSSPHAALRIVEAGIRPALITIGNLEPGPDKRQISTTVFVTAEDEADLRRVLALGVSVLIQPLPSSKPLDVAGLLRP